MFERSRVGATLAAVAVTLGPGAGLASAQVTVADPATDRPALAASVEDCTTGAAAADRTATFTGSMPAIDKATSMAMRFELYERPAGARSFARIRLPSFSAWVRSERNVSGFVYDKRVEQLAAPSAYRVVVRFRWYDTHGKLVRSARRTSATCKQPAAILVLPRP